MKRTDTKALSKQQIEQAAMPAEPVEPEVPQSGSGTFEYRDMTRYVGNWKMCNGNKLKHGHGKIVYPGSQTKGQESFDGDWQEDKMHGYGRYEYTSGAVYSGEWLHGKMSGKGKMVNADGTSYVGDFSENKMHGEGAYTDKDNVTWEGIFNHGCYDSKIQKKMKVEKEIADKVNEYQTKAKQFFV